jgi:hypothetical protein
MLFAQRRVLLLLVCVGAMCLPALGKIAQSERILDYHSDIRVNDDGSMDVTETIRVQSVGRQIRHGIYRDFPTTYTDRLGNSYVVGFELMGTLRDDAPEESRIEDRDNGKRIYLGSSNVFVPNGVHTYVLRYTTNRQLGFFPDHDELFWNVTGNGWGLLIEHASATVHLPATIASDQVHLLGYTGPQGSQQQDLTALPQQDGSFEFTTINSLPPQNGLTIDLTWPKGFFHEPTRPEKLAYFVKDNQGGVLGVTGLAGLFLYYVMVWSMVGRDPQRGVIIPRYEPPAGLSPAAMRYLVRMGYDSKTFAAAVLDMAVKGYLRIKEQDGVYTLTLDQAGSKVLTPDEKSAASDLFDGRTEITLRNENHTTVSSAIKSLKAWLKTAEETIYFVRNSRYMIPAILYSVAVLAGVILLQGTPQKMIFGGFISLWLSGWSVAIAGLAMGDFNLWRSLITAPRFKASGLPAAFFLTLFSIPFFLGELFGIFLLAKATSYLVVLTLMAMIVLHVLFHYLLRAPTLAGRAVLDQVEGFKMFLSAVDGDRLNRAMPPDKTPEVFERFLPFALALDVENAWARKFSGVLDGASRVPGTNNGVYSPTWCEGAGWSTLGATGFAGALGSSFTSAISSSSTAPGSSTGGGSGGGSGGGGGGGGGGGW